MRGAKQIRIERLEWDAAGNEITIDQLRNSLLEVRAKVNEQKRTIIALQGGVRTTYEVVTHHTTGSTRNTRTMTDRFDALNYASGQRIGGESVLLYEVETRRQALYSDGRVIAPFGR